MKTILGVRGHASSYWVGDGFPVRSLFSYRDDPALISPFLVFDYAGPRRFEPAVRPRGVGQHPHRGFETVTIVYDGEVTHRDSTGRGGTIGAGDVQWMTAGAGIIHEEFHSSGFTRAGGDFRVVQLWINLPAKNKMAPAGYQAITAADIPTVKLPEDAGTLRVIAGAFGDTAGPARSFTPINLWDARLNRGASLRLDLPEGHNAMLAVLSGRITIGGSAIAGEAETVFLSREGGAVLIDVEEDAAVLVLTGEPIEEPIAAHGPFVMNSEAELRQAYADFRGGRFGQVAPA